LAISGIVLDLPWKKALYYYAPLENGSYGKEKIVSEAKSLCSDNPKLPFTKLLMALKVTLELDNTKDVKLLLNE